MAIVDDLLLKTELNRNSLLEIKKNKLVSLAYSVLRDPRYAEQLEQLMTKLNVTEEEVIKAYLAYNLDMHSFGNEIYSSMSNKIVLHIHNLMEGSWHQERQNCVLDYIKQTHAKTAIDIGFGVPSKYIRDYVLVKKEIKLTLCDISDTAFQFAALLLDQWDSNWQETIYFKQADMCDVHDIGQYDVYLFQDSIEHVPDPTSCLISYVDMASKDAAFILSIPIGPIIKAHYLAWESDQEATRWLEKCGLKILKHKNVWVNPAVDLFAEQLGSSHHNFMVLCRKFNSNDQF